MITSGAAVTLVITEFNLDIAQAETVDDIRYAIGEADATKQRCPKLSLKKLRKFASKAPVPPSTKRLYISGYATNGQISRTAVWLF